MMGHLPLYWIRQRCRCIGVVQYVTFASDARFRSMKDVAVLSSVSV